MSKKGTTRRSVSVRGTSYIRAQRAAEALGCSVSEVIERGIASVAEQVMVSQVRPDEVPRREPKPNNDDTPGPDFHGSHFTF